ncbi:hypothetical protein [Rugamonas apoptosis]|uniref:Uncharacterized protein n=1 Tax=Rugamonas apoptosis TaxID=2758570 RepID=A0A7W2IJF9_9BURK|nr:hypothetical protein [Rugamonas apoptosis]MBA5686282.1 hypothetical protein [Rugamonas apoptosis]
MRLLSKFIFLGMACSPLICHAGWFSTSCAELKKDLVLEPNLRQDYRDPAPENPIDVVASLTMVDGTAYGRLTAPYKKPLVEVAYIESDVKSCRFSAGMITRLERKSPKSFEVTLTNGKTFTASLYRWRGLPATPFSSDGGVMLDKDNNFAEVRFANWFDSVQLLTMKHEPATDADEEQWQKAKRIEQVEAAGRAKVRQEALAREEARKAEAARAEQERLRRESERKLALLPLIKTVGQKVCLTADGTEDVYLGFVAMGQPQYRTEQRQFVLSGVTENSAGNRILVRIGAIMSFRQAGGAAKYWTELKGDPTYQVNQASWDEAEKWMPCQ